MSETLVLLGIIAAALSGLPGLLWRRSSSGGQWVTTLIAVLGAGLGLAGAGWFWATGASQPVVLPWSILGTEFQVALDGLSAIFLAPIFLVSLLGNVYGLGYWKQTEHPQNGRKLRFFYGTVTAGMALLVIARTSIVFLFGWEIMALSAYFLVTTEDEENEVQEAGWLYLVATHTSTLCLFAMFALIHSVNPHFFALVPLENIVLLHSANHSFTQFPLDQAALNPGVKTAIFVLALFGFGLKAGIMPLHVWLPSTTPRPRATSPPSCRASSSRWGSTGWCE